MNLLLDTHVLLWAAEDSRKLSARARRVLLDSEVQLWFSAASIWEIVIKSALVRSNITVNSGELRRALLIHGYEELPVTGLHALAVKDSPVAHHDPFDRILLAQASVEGQLLATVDKRLVGLPQVMDVR